MADTNNMMNDDRKQGRGWNAPVYSQSAAADINPDLIRENRCIGMFSELPETDAYKVLKTQVHKLLRERGWNTLMVTSARAGEGKTLTAINLSLVLAKEYAHTVLLVDCNFKNQQVHSQLGIESDKGLTDYLLGGRELKDLIVWPGIEKFTFISGGASVWDSSELLNSPAMKSLIPEIKSRYSDRYIIFDAPAVLEGADAIAFFQLVEGIVLVVDHGRTTKKDLRSALELIPKEKFLGFILNRKPIPARTTRIK
jgi:non-specific protein-tyrosine kinase